VNWTLSFLAEYDVSSNPHGFGDWLLPLIRRAQTHALGLRQADSITIDFHKMGWGHYPGSAFLVNNRSDLRYLARDVSETPYFSEADGRRDPALFTLECSRPALGPYSVMASLNAIGMTGWQLLTARALELAQRLKDRLAELDHCMVSIPAPSVPPWSGGCCPKAAMPATSSPASKPASSRARSSPAMPPRSAASLTCARNPWTAPATPA
jgi:glutamate/tyrosine decarboxylase-like PLP-dependent enzyme